MRKSVMIILIGLMLVGICGSSWAGVTATDVVCTECVNDTDIAAAAVTNVKLGDGAVTGTKILDGSVTSTKIADGTVTDSKISGLISASKIEKPANVVIVAATGGDFTSIQAALDSITPTVDTPYVIKVMPGTYTESVTMKSYVHLQGAGRDVTKVTFGEAPWYVIKCENVVNVAISGFTIDGYWGINNNNSSPTISENRFKDTYSGTEGIVNSNSSPAITNNSFEMSKTNSRGIRNSGSSSPVISGNQIMGNGVSSIGINNNWPSKPTIINNTIKGMLTGIKYESGGSPVCGEEGSLIAGNVIEGNQVGLSNYAVSPIIKNNIIKNNSLDGISSSSDGAGHWCGMSLSAPTIDNNLISGNGRYGINGGNPTILHNKVTANAISDIYVSPWSGTSITIGFNSYDTIAGSGAVGNYNLKSDGTTAPLQ